ncbi:MAG: histidine kinase [Pseudomonadota bacterium]|nr:histidine kinase [Pseudomonadota bacterium]
MKKPNPPSSEPGIELSSLTKAELVARLEALPCAPRHTLETCPAQSLLLELRTQHVELETQNQELRESQQRIEEARDRYSDLYDFAPVGYVTLDGQGCMREINLTGAAMLGREREEVIGKPLILWLREESHDVFYLHLRRVRAGEDRVVDEVALRGGDTPRHISMVSAAIGEGREEGHACRTALVDITRLKKKELELTHSRQQLRELSAHLDLVREGERRHIAREIHDELGQKLMTLRFAVAMLGTGPDTPVQGLPQIKASLLRQIDDTIEAVRAIASDLRPAVLDLGLAAAIEWQVQDFRRRTGIACTLKMSEEEIALDDERATAIFRIVQESLTNIARHADAGKATLKMARSGGRLLIEIADDGIGLSAAALNKPRSFGIAGMRERLLPLDGTLEISSRPGRGTKLKVSIPLPGE